MSDLTKNELTWNEFTKVEMRVGTIVSAEAFEAARKPAYILLIDFGDYGLKKTSAQITKLYTPDQLVGQQAIAVINFPPKQIANIMSECLVLAAVGTNDQTTLIHPERAVPNGTLIG